MADEPKVTAPVTDAPVVETPPVEKPLTLEELQVKLAKAELHAANKEEEAKRHFAKLQKFEEAEQKTKEAQMSEIEKANAKTAQLEAENKRLKTESLKTSIAAKLGLPESLALRLQGETPAEIEADAKEIMETLPKKTAVNINVTNPGAGAVVGETDDEKGRRLGTRR